MSLVNDMLRDLDERKRESSAGYRAVAKHDSRVGRWVWIALFIILAAMVVFFVARELGVKIDDRADFLSVFNKETSQSKDQQQQFQQQPEQQQFQQQPEQQQFQQQPEQQQFQQQPEQQQFQQQPEQQQFQQQPEQQQFQPEAQGKAVTSSKVLQFAPEKTPPALTTINVINWTSASKQRGHLTFWLDQAKPFVLYSQTSTLLDISIDESRLATQLPNIKASLLAAIEIVPEKGKSRIKLIANGPVQFTPQLKQNPPRLVIDISSVAAIEVAAIEETSVVKNNSQNIATGLVTQAVTEQKSNTEATAVFKKQTPPQAQEQAANQAVSQLKGQWKKSLNTLPTDSSVVRSARRLLSQQRGDEALDLLKDYVSKVPSALQSRYLLVQLYLATERYTVAAHILQTAPDNLSWGLLKARTFLQQGKAQQAIQLLEQYPDGQNRQDYLEILASGYQQAGRHGAAVARYLRLLGLNPQEGRWWINLGVSLEHLGEKTKALEAYRSALQIPNLDQSLKQYAQNQAKKLM